VIDCNEWRTEKRHECANIGESKTTRIIMATVPHVPSGLGLIKFQADGFLLIRVYVLVILVSLTLLLKKAQLFKALFTLA